MPDNGTDVVFENDLGFGASESQQIQKGIEWDGEIYPIDTVVKAGLDMTIYKLSYTWSFISTCCSTKVIYPRNYMIEMRQL